MSTDQMSVRYASAWLAATIALCVVLLTLAIRQGDGCNLAFDMMFTTACIAPWIYNLLRAVHQEHP